MSKIAFIFPGQGAQYVGMGKDFYNTCEIARQTFEEANDRLGLNIAQICFEGPEEELMLTENTQPAILTTSIAILRVLQQESFLCDYTAGLSLGEYSALVNAEALDFSDAVEIVKTWNVYATSGSKWSWRYGCNCRPYKRSNNKCCRICKKKD